MIYKYLMDYVQRSYENIQKTFRVLVNQAHGLHFLVNFGHYVNSDNVLRCGSRTETFLLWSFMLQVSRDIDKSSGIL